MKNYSLIVDTSNDRSRVIVASIYLEELLEELLRKHFVKNSFKQLVNENSSLYYKIHLSFALGLISEHEADLLHIIRKIRNQCAHGLSSNETDDISLKDSKLIKELQAFIPQSVIDKLPQVMKFEAIKVRKYIDQETSRVLFVAIAKNLIKILESRIESTKKQHAPKSIPLHLIGDLLPKKDVLKLI